MSDPRIKAGTESVHLEEQPPKWKYLPSEGRLVYDGIQFIFLETKKGPVMFAEIRGFGGGLPQNANAEKLVRLWNEDYERSQVS